MCFRNTNGFKSVYANKIRDFFLCNFDCHYMNSKFNQFSLLINLNLNRVKKDKQGLHIINADTINICCIRDSIQYRVLEKMYLQSTGKGIILFDPGLH